MASLDGGSQSGDRSLRPAPPSLGPQTVSTRRNPPRKTAVTRR